MLVMATNDVLNPDYRSISELPTRNGAPVGGSELLILSEPPEGSNAGYVSYQVSIKDIEPCISADIKNPIKEYVTEGFKDLVYANKTDLEYNSETHGTNAYELTSFAVKALSTTAARIEAQTKAGKLYAISAVSWNDNLVLTASEDIELTQLSTAAYNRVMAELNNLGIRDGVVVTNLVEDEGIALAKIKTKNNNWHTIYSGDPSKLVKVEPQTTVGDSIAKITFGGTNQVVTIKNALSVNAVPPTYNPSLGNTGEIIGYVNRVALRNNLSIISDEDAKSMHDISYGQYGDNIARINGKYIKNGLNLTGVDTEGKVIVNINGHPVRNGIVVKDQPSPRVGRKMCKIADVDIYNNVNVDDWTNNGAGKAGDRIANINGTDIYNGIVITDNEALHQSYINGHAMLGGIKLGNLTNKTTVGDIVAEIETSDRIAYIYNGINVKSLSNDIVSKLEAEIAALRAQHEADMAWIRNELKKYMLLNSGSAMQTVVGPTTFSQTINGNITNANYAVKANWA